MDRIIKEGEEGLKDIIMISINVFIIIFFLIIDLIVLYPWIIGLYIGGIVFYFIILNQWRLTKREFVHNKVSGINFISGHVVHSNGSEPYLWGIKQIVPYAELTEQEDSAIKESINAITSEADDRDVVEKEDKEIIIEKKGRGGKHN